MMLNIKDQEKFDEVFNWLWGRINRGDFYAVKDGYCYVRIDIFERKYEDAIYEVCEAFHNKGYDIIVGQVCLVYDTPYPGVKQGRCFIIKQ